MHLENRMTVRMGYASGRHCHDCKVHERRQRSNTPGWDSRAGMAMTEVVELLFYKYGWSGSVPNLSGKLRRGSLRYGEAV